MHRLLIAFFVFLMSLAAPVAAQGFEGESRAPYTVTQPGGWTGSVYESLPWSRPSSSAAPRKSITAKAPVRQHQRPAFAELEQRERRDQAKRMAALEKMSAENARRAAALNKRDALQRERQVKAFEAAKAAPAPAVPSAQVRPADSAKPKTIYLKPENAGPSKVFPGAL